MTDWIKSSACNDGTCVEVAAINDSVLVQHSGRVGTLVFSREEWAAFIAGVKEGEFDLNG